MNRLILAATRLLLLFAMPACQLNGPVRTLGLEPDKWANELDKRRMSEPNSLGSLTLQLLDAHSISALRFWDSLEQAGKSKGYYFKTRFNITKADYLFKRCAGLRKFSYRVTRSLEPVKSQIIRLHRAGIDAVYHTEDDLIIGWASFYSSRIMHHLGETSWAVMYAKSGAELIEKTGYDVEPPVFTWLSELLFDIREYSESNAIARKAIAAWGRVKDKEYNEKWLQEYHIRAWNILGLNLYQQQRYDSAQAVFGRALQIASAMHDTVWIGKVNINRGKVLLQKRAYDSAHQVLASAARYGQATGIYENAADAGVWAARANTARGNTGAALAEARIALGYSRRSPNPYTVRDAYQLMSEIFRQTKEYDSAFFYTDRYGRLNDSLEKALVTSSLVISKARLNDEVSRFNIQKLNREKKEAVLWRNSIMIFIVVLACIALLVANRRLLQQKIKSQLAEQQNRLMEQQMQSANEQLRLFTSSIIEKNNMIAQLEQEMNNQQTSQEHYANISNLSHYTILTEEDWQQFKLLYEKVYPGFFSKLTTQFPDITLAEQRMAALLKLQLSSQQMASMLGISADSVRKSKQRLRQRFQVSAHAKLDELVAKL